MRGQVRNWVLGVAISAALAGTVSAQVLADAGAATAADEKSALTPSRMFQVLAADVAFQRGEYDVAAKIYLELATNLKDPRLARRAAQAATLARQPALVLEAAKVWANLEPESSQARNTLAAVLISQG